MVLWTFRVLGSGWVDEHRGGRLVDQIRQQFDAGALPRQQPRRIFGGCGVAMSAAVAAIGCTVQGSLKFEIAGRTGRLHTGCYGLWEGELIRRGLFTPR
jgi:hypothetical protein